MSDKVYDQREEMHAARKKANQPEADARELPAEAKPPTLIYAAGMIGTFESGAGQSLDFCVYASNEVLKLSDAERVKERLLTINFPARSDAWKFFAVNYECIDRIIEALKSLETKRSH